MGSFSCVTFVDRTQACDHIERCDNGEHFFVTSEHAARLHIIPRITADEVMMRKYISIRVKFRVSFIIYQKRMRVPLARGEDGETGETGDLGVCEVL